MFTRAFLIPTVERMIRGVVIGAFLVILDGAKDALTRGAFNAFSADWGDICGYGIGGGVIALGLSVLARQTGPVGSPSFVRDRAAAGYGPPDEHAGEHRADLQQRLTDGRNEP